MGCRKRLVDYLSENDFDINIKDPVTGDTAFLTVVRFNHVESLKLLLARQKLNLLARNNVGDSALTLAVKGGDFDTVRLVTKADKNKIIKIINAENKVGYTALDINNQNLQMYCFERRCGVHCM